MDDPISAIQIELSAHKTKRDQSSECRERAFHNGWVKALEWVLKLLTK